MNGLRQAALALHGLAPVDQEWLLSRLPVQRSAELRELLEELRDIGIPADPELIGHAIATRPATAAQPGQRAARSMTLSAQQAHTLLAGEPDELIAIVLSGDGWPWREAFLARLASYRSQRIREMAASRVPGPALRRAVLDTFAGRAELCADAAPASISAKPSRTWTLLPGRLAQKWRAWTR